MKRICVVTGSRAEYGLLLPLLKRMKKDRRLRLQLIVTGSHLESAFGSTHKQIEEDGFTINAKVPIYKGSAAAGISAAAAKAVSGLAAAYIKLKPGLVVVLGDRFEILSAAFAAHLNRIPIAHIHGGELTEGSLDDGMRHAITKLSSLHFAAAEPYRKRIIQMGEHPSNVFNVGALGIENARTLKLLSRTSLQKQINLKFQSPLAVVTLHPATNEKVPTNTQVKELLKALDMIPQLQLVFTYPNADEGSDIIIKAIRDFCKRNSERSGLYKSLGAVNYLSLLQYADLVIGNSSSGLIEVPEFKIPTVNIGDRQQARLAGKSVINSEPLKESIYHAIQKALSAPFRKLCRTSKNPYGSGNTSKAIIDILGSYNTFSLKKTFYDLNEA